MKLDVALCKIVPAIFKTPLKLTVRPRALKVEPASRSKLIKVPVPAVFMVKDELPEIKITFELRLLEVVITDAPEILRFVIVAAAEYAKVDPALWLTVVCVEAPKSIEAPLRL